MLKQSFLPLVFAVTLLFLSCHQNKEAVSKNTANSTSPLKSGEWLFNFNLGSTIMPVRVVINENAQIIIQNASEKIICSNTLFSGDSVFFRAPVFENEFRGRLHSNSKITGTWHNLSKKNYVIPFTASWQRNKSKADQQAATVNKQYNWEVVFSPGTKDVSKAIGVFIPLTQADLFYPNSYEGTFMTETGDYRYLSGYRKNDSLLLSAFDGSHVFLFKASFYSNGDSLRGIFYSGNHWTENWVAGKNPMAKLTHPDSLTYLVHKDSVFKFSFPDLEGKTVSYPSDPFKNKITIVQIMGSWCPNCMDETNYLMNIYRKYQSKGVEVVSLCFERTDDFVTSVKHVTRMKESLHATYPFLIAGTSNKSQAQQKLPMLNHIMSFPTTIYLDKKGRTRKIYTGFYGPSTGKYHEKFVEENQRFIEKLLAEQ